MEEIWKDIPRFKGYQASNLGRIRTYNKTTYTEKHGIRHWKNRILKFKPSTSSKGNIQGMGYRVALWQDGKPTEFLVARIIATTFLEDLIDSNMTVNHKNGNRLDNRAENLEWVTRKGNITYGFDNDQYRNICVKCKLIGGGKEYEFRSMSKASLFLGRNEGYISNSLKRKSVIRDINKCEYEFEALSKYLGGNYGER